MHLSLPHLVYSGPPVDDPAVLARLPAPLAAALQERNGCVAYLGALHVRGACHAPAWHSLRHAWEGADAYCALYPTVTPTDVPFAEDAFGNQFLLREGRVELLEAESGELHPVAPTLEAFFASVLSDPSSILAYEPLTAMARVGGRLEPGQLLSVYPPFVVAESANGVSLKPMDALERRLWLADL